ncbi:MAG: type II secretion system protein GspN [Deltaproteobacteria bacterium CG11_big_fil_rev_8_21_14_0_20_45_16]|nr:MAG: type II secretion system protein GspN [Deltaproteobacteria bacterium CG11_big_fil_rev_8_21_14_0_20_45_16]
MIRRWFSIIGFGLFLFVIFVMLTFPFERIGPRISRQLEQSLYDVFRTTLSCELSGFGFHLPLGVRADLIVCKGRRPSESFQVSDLKLRLLPFSQRASFKMGEGSAEIHTNFGFSTHLKNLRANIRNLDIKQILPLVYQLIRNSGALVLIQPDVEGQLNAQLDLPIDSWPKGTGSIELEAAKLKLPTQPALEFIGLNDLNFDEAKLKAELKDSKLSIKTFNLLSTPLSAKLTGDLDLDGASLMTAKGTLLFKWKVQQSDALMSSQFGSILLDAPCSSPDAQGFCAKSITQLQEITRIFGN